MICGGVAALIKFVTAIRPPKVVSVSEQVATTMVAPGAAALDHSASAVVSSSSVVTPGSEQFEIPFRGVGCTVSSDPEVYLDNPNVVRKVFQSAEVYRLLSSTTAMVCPWPVIPAAKAGFRS